MVQRTAAALTRWTGGGHRTCEAALHKATGRPYGSFVSALERLTRPGAGAA
jgi:hypothetical protein